MQKNNNILFIYLVILGVFFGTALLLSNNAVAATTPSVVPTSPPISVLRPAAIGVFGVPSPDGNIYVCPNISKDASGNIVYPRYPDEYPVGHPQAGQPHPKAGMIDEEAMSAGFTTRFVPCIRDTIFYATMQVFQPLATAFSSTVIALFTLAVAVFGISVIAGRASLTQEGIILSLKMGAIIFFTGTAVEYYPTLIDSLQYFLEMIAKPAVANDFLWAGLDTNCSVGSFTSEPSVMKIWNILDCYIEMLIGGIFSNASVGFGILGFLFAVAVSTPLGLFIGFIGLYFLLTFLFTIARVVYIFITSYIAFSFMIIISVFFLPCILFQTTKKYFDGWLSLAISFFIQPIFLFGYLIMFLFAINVTILQGKNSLYATIAGEAATPTSILQIGKWLGSNKEGDPDNKGNYTSVILDKEWTKLNYRGALSEISGGYTKKDTAIKDTQGNMQPPTGQASIALSTVPPTSGSAFANYFSTGIRVDSINWRGLTQKARATEWDVIANDPNNSPLDINLQQDKLVSEYQISILLSFIMSATVMYLFFSLLGYIPYIGNAATSSGLGIPLGGAGLSMPGSRIFSGVGG